MRPAVTRLRVALAGRAAAISAVSPLGRTQQLPERDRQRDRHGTFASAWMAARTVCLDNVRRR